MQIQEEATRPKAGVSDGHKPDILRAPEELEEQGGYPRDRVPEVTWFQTLAGFKLAQLGLMEQDTI